MKLSTMATTKGHKFTDQVMKVIECVVDSAIDTFIFGFVPGRGTTDIFLFVSCRKSTELSKNRSIFPFWTLKKL